MVAFICVCDHITLLPTLKEKCWGVEEKYREKILAINADDELFIYAKAGSQLSKKGAICGPLKAINNAHNPDSGFYFNRNYHSIVALSNDDRIRWLPFNELVENLNCVKNKSHWGMIFMGRAIITIDDGDSKYISDALKESGRKIRM